MTTPEYDEAYWEPKHVLLLKELPVAPPLDFFRRDLHRPGKPWYQREYSPIHDILVEVADERRRQIVEKGFTSAHDDRHESGELTQAALWFLTAPSALGHGDRIYFWPWPTAREADPYTPRQSLIQACALLVAEIERLDRLDVRTTERRG